MHSGVRGNRGGRVGLWRAPIARRPRPVRERHMPRRAARLTLGRVRAPGRLVDPADATLRRRAPVTVGDLFQLRGTAVERPTVPDCASSPATKPPGQEPARRLTPRTSLPPLHGKPLRGPYSRDDTVVTPLVPTYERATGLPGAVRRRVGLKVALLLGRPVNWTIASIAHVGRAARTAVVCGSMDRAKNLCEHLSRHAAQCYTTPDGAHIGPSTTVRVREWHMELETALCARYHSLAFRPAAVHKLKPLLEEMNAVARALELLRMHVATSGAPVAGADLQSIRGYLDSLRTLMEWSCDPDDGDDSDPLWFLKYLREPPPKGEEGVVSQRPHFTWSVLVGACFVFATTHDLPVRTVCLAVEILKRYCAGLDPESPRRAGQRIEIPREARIVAIITAMSLACMVQSGAAPLAVCHDLINSCGIEDEQRLCPDFMRVLAWRCLRPAQIPAIDHTLRIATALGIPILPEWLRCGADNVSLPHEEGDLSRPGARLQLAGLACVFYTGRALAVLRLASTLTPRQLAATAVLVAIRMAFKLRLVAELDRLGKPAARRKSPWEPAPGSPWRTLDEAWTPAVAALSAPLADIVPWAASFVATWPWGCQFSAAEKSHPPCVDAMNGVRTTLGGRERMHLCRPGLAPAGFVASVVRKGMHWGAGSKRRLLPVIKSL